MALSEEGQCCSARVNMAYIYDDVLRDLLGGIVGGKVDSFSFAWYEELF